MFDILIKERGARILISASVYYIMSFSKRLNHFKITLCCDLLPGEGSALNFHLLLIKIVIRRTNTVLQMTSNMFDRCFQLVEWKPILNLNYSLQTLSWHVLFWILNVIGTLISVGTLIGSWLCLLKPVFCNSMKWMTGIKGRGGRNREGEYIYVVKYKISTLTGLYGCNPSSSFVLLF